MTQEFPREACCDEYTFSPLVSSPQNEDVIDTVVDVVVERNGIEGNDIDVRDSDEYTNMYQEIRTDLSEMKEQLRHVRTTCDEMVAAAKENYALIIQLDDRFQNFELLVRRLLQN